MSEQNLTVWQRLSQTFGPNSLLKQDYPTFKFDKKELLRTPNRDDYEREKLQAQQTYYLTNQWAKVENNLYSQAIYYEPSRLSAQYDYESMEYTPEISAALDIYSEESTTTNEDGFLLQIQDMPLVFLMPSQVSFEYTLYLQSQINFEHLVMLLLGLAPQGHVQE